MQLRDKLGNTRDLLGFSRKALGWLKGRIPFIVNDRVDVARLSGAAGVHLGQEDIPIFEARKILGNRAIIGVSCQTLDHVRLAYRQGADYAGFGSVFKTLTKPDRALMDLAVLSKAVRYAEQKSLPLFAIGGITTDNLEQVVEKGVRRIALCRNILLSDNPCCTIGKIRAVFTGSDEC